MVALIFRPLKIMEIREPLAPHWILFLACGILGIPYDVYLLGLNVCESVHNGKQGIDFF